MSQLVDAQLSRPGLPFDFEPSSFEQMHSSLGDPVHSALVRQRVVEIDDGDGGDIAVLMRFNPTVDPWIPLLRMIEHHRHPISVRVTALPTEATVADRSQLTESMRAAARMHADLTDRAELFTPARRALATLSDVASSFTSPVFCGELAIVSAAPIPERLARSIATCFTSDSEVLRRSGSTVVAGQAVMLGGFEIEREVARHGEALQQGLPLRGGLIERDLRDLWTLTEAPISWPVPVGTPAPGIRSGVRRALPSPVDLMVEPDAGGLRLGADGQGNSIWIDDVTSRRHVALWGRTGCGKTSLMIDMMRRDIEQCASFAFIDPHSDAGRRVVAIADGVGRDVVVIDMGDPATSSIYWAPRLDDRDDALLVEASVRAFIDAVVSHLPEEWAGPRFFQGATALLVAACAHGCDIATAVDLVNSASGVQILVNHDHLPTWVGDYLLSLHSRTHTDASAIREWITSKFNALFAGPARSLFATPGRGIDLGRAVLDGDVVVVNLAGLAPVDAKIVGHVVLAQLTAAIMGRGAIGHDKSPVRIYVDEAPRFYSHNLELLMTGGRKFGAALVLASQAPNQFDGVVGDQAMAAETQVVFAQTPGGASMLAAGLDVPATELVGQPDFHAYVKSGQLAVAAVSTPRYRAP